MSQSQPLSENVHKTHKMLKEHKKNLFDSKTFYGSSVDGFYVFNRKCSWRGSDYHACNSM